MGTYLGGIIYYWQGEVNMKLKSILILMLMFFLVSGCVETQTRVVSENRSEPVNEDNLTTIPKQIITPANSEPTNIEQVYRDMTDTELRNFIKSDTTDRDHLNCYEASYQLAERAREKGYASSVVKVSFDNCYYYVNGFNTTDRGMVYADCAERSGDPSLYDKYYYFDQYILLREGSLIETNSQMLYGDDGYRIQISYARDKIKSIENNWDGIKIE